MENELKKRAKFHRKRQKGLPALSTLNPNAGNVEYNVAMFNKMNSPAEGPINNPISGPMGGDVSAPAASGMGESVSINNEWMLIKNSKWYDPEGLGIEPKGAIICSGTEEECREVFSEFVIEARQKDRLYREQAIKGHHRPMMKIENLDAYSLVLSYPNAQAKDVYQLVQKKDNTVTETLNESAMTREQMISELQKAGKRFYFAKYTDGQIYNMYMKYVVNAPKAVDDTVPVEQEPEVFEEKPTCPDCGTRLTDGGYCPKCDDGEEDMDEMLTEGRHDPYWTPYGYRAAAKVITGSAPEYYYHLKEIEMDTGDGIKLAKYAVKKGLPVMVDIKSDPDYPEFYLKDGSNEYHWNDYFYPYGTAHLASRDYVPYTGQEINMLTESVNEVTVTDNISIIGQNVVLYYDSLTVIAYGPKRDVDDWDELEVDTETTYTVDASDVIEFLYSIVPNEEFPADFDDYSEKQFDEYWKHNLERLIKEYEKQILSNWEEDAAENAEEQVDYAELKANGEADYYDTYYHESLKNNNYDDDFDMSTRSLL